MEPIMTPEHGTHLTHFGRSDSTGGTEAPLTSFLKVVGITM